MDALGFLVGILLGAASLLIIERLFQRKRRLVYGLMLVVIPLIYVAFALRDTNPPLGLAVMGLIFFSALGLGGWLWLYPLLGMGLLLHAAWDLLHMGPLAHAGVPEWYPAACAAYDAVVGLYLLRPRELKKVRAIKRR